MKEYFVKIYTVVRQALVSMSAFGARSKDWLAVSVQTIVKNVSERYSKNQVSWLLVIMTVGVVLFAVWQIAAYSLRETIYVSVNLVFVAFFALILLYVLIVARRLVENSKSEVHEKHLLLRKREAELRSLKSELMEMKTIARHQQTFGLKSQVFVNAVARNRAAAEPGSLPGQFLMKALAECYEICGGIVYLNDEATGKCLLAGTFALSDEPVVREVEAGAGFLWQAYSSGKVVVVDDVPDSYLTVLSGLGSTNKVSLSFLPLKKNSEVIGVIEISSFGKLGLVDIWNDVCTGLSIVL